MGFKYKIVKSVRRYPFVFFGFMVPYVNDLDAGLADIWEFSDRIEKEKSCVAGNGYSIIQENYSATALAVNLYAVKVSRRTGEWSTTALIFSAFSQSLFVPIIFSQPTISLLARFDIAVLNNESFRSPPEASRDFTERVQEVPLTIWGLSGRRSEHS